MSDNIKAGTYEVIAPFWDEYLSKPGEPFDFKRHRKGEKVELDVEQARRLVRAGAVRKPGQKADAPPGSGPSMPPGESGKQMPAPPKEPTVADILKDVGDDPAKAQTALEAEQAKGEDARGSLVAKLEAVIAKGASS